MTQWGLDTLFNPAKRHMDEEKRRLQSTREEAGDSSGGRRIDLESGKVKIKRGERRTEPAESDDSDSDENEATAEADGVAAESDDDTALVDGAAAEAPEQRHD